MSEIQQQVNMYQVNYQCDSCSSANVVRDLSNIHIKNIKYTCPNCKATIQLDKIYPYIEYK